MCVVLNYQVSGNLLQEINTTLKFMFYQLYTKSHYFYVLSLWTEDRRSYKLKKVGESIFTKYFGASTLSVKKGSQVMTVETFAGSLSLSTFPLLAILSLLAIFVTALFIFMLSKKRR